MVKENSEETQPTLTNKCANSQRMTVSTCHVEHESSGVKVDTSSTT